MNINPRLLNLARDSRTALLIAILAGGVGGLLTIGQARALSLTVAGIFLDHQSLQGVSHLLRGLIFFIVGRSVLVWVGEVSAKAVAIRVKHNLREQLFAHILKLGPAYTRRERTGELTAAVVEGIEALDAYFSQYLPQLVLSAIVPISILLFVFPLDLLSGLIFILTAPLIPIFMILIGKAAETLTNRQYLTLSRLSAHFLDSLQGLTTLKLFGQSKRHTRSIEQASEQFRKTTMSVLRVTFLSALVLELAATLSTAVIAVEVGLRLLYARMTFEDAFFLLILAPEFYHPLRMLGLRFHAGMSGTSAARKIFEILDLPLKADQTPAAGNLKTALTPNLEPGTPNHLPCITFDGVSFTYPDETEPALENIDLTIHPGQHLALVGASGSGKSTLVQLLLGFISPNAGQILVDSRPMGQTPIEGWRQKIAWVPQKPFIFNTSIADNIRLGKPDADRDALRAAAQAAHLDTLIESLPEGYQTVVGEGGARLSGGETQRLALARAFLKDAPILILDEPTSHLDPINESRLEESIQNLIGQTASSRNMCGEQSRTVITIAHRLNTITQADQIAVLEAGKLIECGTYEEFRGKKHPFAGNLHPRIKTLSPKKHSPVSPSSFSVKRENVLMANLPSSRQSPKTFLRLLGFLKGSWRRVVLLSLIGTGTVLSSLGLIGTSAWLISRAALHPSVAELQVAIVGVRFFGISRGVLRYVERLISHDITFRLLSRLRPWFYQAIEPLAPACLMRYRSGDLLSRVRTDVDALENFYIRVVSPIITALLISLGAVAYLGYFDIRMGFALLVLLLGVGVLVPQLIRFASRKTGERLVDCRARMHAHLVESIQGMADLMMFGQVSEQKRKISQIGRDYRREQRKMVQITGFHSSVSLFFSNLGMWLVLSFGIDAVSKGIIPGEMLGTLALIALVSFEAVQPLPLAAQILGEISQSASRLFELVDRKPEVSEIAGEELNLSHPLDIQFLDLTFTYPDEKEPTLRNIQFEIPEGRSIAVVGPSGAGKSTLVNLLLRFWDYHTGEILFGGQPLKSLIPDDLRARMGVVSQQSYFFNASIRENLSLGRPDASQPEIEDAARQVQIHEFIVGLPDGYDTFIGEQGLRLSGGERQRLAIARALLKDSPILILDEPTANLDPVTERHVFETIYGWVGSNTQRGEPRTTLLITHRLIGLENMDEIIVMDQGRIIERGTHRELLGAGNLYARLNPI
jgi:ATP-binding cassette subfamily C protein CydCD